MQRLKGQKVKLAFVLAASVVIIAVLMFSVLNINVTRNPLTDAIESGETTFTAIDRNHESIINFANERPAEAEDLLKTAQISQEQAKTSLTYARHTDDEFVLNMAQNYGYLLESSYVMNQGVDNLLEISDDLERALNYYSQKSYASAADAASVCLQTLEPLVGDFDAKNQSLENINYRYLASGQKNQVKYAAIEYRDSMAIYLQYVQLLKSLKEGVAYKQKTDEINSQFNQVQNDVANGAYDDAQQQLDELSKQLESLRDSEFQKAAALASQLNPSLFGGKAQSTAQDLKNQLKDLTGIDSFQNYLKAVQQYTQASTYLANGQLTEAEEAANQALSMLAQSAGQSGQGGDVSKYSQALEFALNSLKMQIKGEPDLS
jgi:hypothetical protein